MPPLLPTVLAAVVATAPVLKPPPAPPPGTDVQLTFVDDSTLKATLLDDKLEVVTKYGTLQVPAADVRKVEFATRLSSADVATIAAALGDLGKPEFKVRDKASADLRALKGRAYPALQKAVESPNAEVRDRVEELIAQIKRVTPAAQLEPRPADVVYTADSKIAGKLSVAALRLKTFQFGEQAAKLTDLRTMTIGALGDPGVVLPAPPNLANYANRFGEEATFSITYTGAVVNNNVVFGTDVYTLDSSFQWAAIHAGLLRPQVGSTATVRVRIVASPAQFTGSQRNGASSQPYGHYPPGAFEFVAK